MGLLFLSTLLDYLYGFGVASSSKRRSTFFLWLSVINNLGILAVFKYYNFFATELQSMLHAIGLETNPVLLNIALPVGISFYTFHGMSYVFDIYRKQQQPVRNFVDYAVFVSFFPLLVAGPIERAHHLLPQVQRKRTFSYPQAIDGCRLILWGLVKKVVIADTLAETVNVIFENSATQSSSILIVGMIAFSFQIYGDFSGYSDIALGTAKLFGFELLSNFRFPYFSRNIAEFWRRWHISLSSWFRDYLYIPLGGSKGTRYQTIRNTFIIFIVSGFWHGASWNFIVWGAIHALAFLPLLVLNRNRQFVGDVVAQERKLPTFREFRQLLGTFFVVSLAWIFFRAPDISTALQYIARLGADALNHPSQFLHLPQYISCFVYILPLILIDWHFRRNERQLDIPFPKWLRVIVYLVCIELVLFHLNVESDFIYFQF